MQDDGGASTVFLRGVDQWVGGLGRLRDVVRQHVLAAQLSEVLAKRGLVRARVLDVGCGQGTQSLWLARAGHEVTGLDISAELLLRFSETLAVDRPRYVTGSGWSRVRVRRRPRPHRDRSMSSCATAC